MNSPFLFTVHLPSNLKKGKKLSEETKRKISEAHKRNHSLKKV